MMNNLFSSFDPSSSNSNSWTNWMSLLIITLMIPSKLWLIPSKFSMLNKMINKFMNKETKTIMEKKNHLNSLLYTSLFTLIAINNFMGLMPYVFTGTSHMILNTSLALTLWTSIMMFKTINNFNKMMAHLVPTSTPTLLMSFMVIIESISTMIQPLALAIRLSANMIAGHLILTLISSSMSPTKSLFLSPLIAQSLLLILEMAVSMIQAYVFTILISLYTSN